MNTTPLCRFDVCDAPHINKLGMKFNVVILSTVLGYLKDVESTLRLIRDVLTIPGQMILTTSNGYGPYQFFWARPYTMVLPLLRRIVGRTATEGGTQINWYTYKKMCRLITDAGFTINASKNSDFISFLIRIPSLAKLDCKLADALPPALSSGWCLDCQLSSTRT
jgi:hypothetical protein